MRVAETVHAEPSRIIETPYYRVNFWEQSAGGGAWALDAFVLIEAHEIIDVLEWVAANAHGRRSEIFVETGEEPVSDFATPRRSDLLRISGTNPNEGVTVPIGSFVQS